MKTIQLSCLIMLLLIMCDVDATSNVMKNRTDTGQSGQSNEQQANTVHSCEWQQQTCYVQAQEPTGQRQCDIQFNGCLENLLNDTNE